MVHFGHLAQGDGVYEVKLVRQWELYSPNRTETDNPDDPLFFGRTARLGGWWFCFKGWIIYTFGHREYVKIKQWEGWK